MLPPQLIMLAYWVVMIVLAAFFLRQACSLWEADMPFWKRAVISTFIVTFLAYLAFDYTCYIIMRCVWEDVARLLPWYGYTNWFREPFAVKWAIASKAGPFKYFGIVFALCVAGA